MWSDAHTHLSFLDDTYLEDHLARCQENGINGWLQGGYDEDDWVRQSLLKKRYSGVRTCYGIHPWKVRMLSSSDLQGLKKSLLQLVHECDLIGETGIDASGQNKSFYQAQEALFQWHLSLASELKKPLVLHVVQAHGRALEMLAPHAPLRGIVHAFNGAPETARQYRRLGLLISIGPGVLRPGFRKLKETAKTLSMSDFVVESDQPDSPETTSVSPDTLLEVARTLGKHQEMADREVLDRSQKNLDTLWR